MNRRRVLYGGKEEELYEGFEYNKALVGGDLQFNLVDKEGYCISPYYPIVDRTKYVTVKFGYTDTAMGANCFRSDSGIMSGSGDSRHYMYAARIDPRTFAPNNSDIKFLRCTFKVSELDNCYIKIGGEYIFKGKNVE